MVLHAYCILLMQIDFMWMTCADLLALGFQALFAEARACKQDSIRVRVLCWTRDLSQQQQL